MKSLDNRRRLSIEKRVLREVELLRDAKSNPSGFKRWQRISDKQAAREVCRWALGC